MDLQSAGQVAVLLANAVSSIDKIYRGYADFFKKKDPAQGAPPPDFTITNDPAKRALVATSASNAKPQQTVTYEELRAKLTPSDRDYIDTLNQALANYEQQWNSAYVAKSLASGMDVGRYDAQLNYLAREIAGPLLKALSFVERTGLWLDDHYLAARDIAEKYLKIGQASA